MKITKLSDVITHLQHLKEKYGDIKIKSIDIKNPAENGWVIEI